MKLRQMPLTGLKPILLGVFGLALVFSIGFAVFQKYSLGNYQTLTYGSLIGQQVINYVIKIVYLFFVIRCTTHLLSTNRSWWVQVGAHVTMLFGFISFCAWAVMWVGHFLSPADYGTSLSDWFSRFTIGLTYNYFIYLTVVAIVIAYFYIEKERDEALKRTEVERLLTESRLLRLQNQLNPHFLFNTLHSISSMIDEDADTAQDAIANLSELLRYNLSFGQQQTIAFAKELDVTSLYTSILKLRFAEKLQFTFDIPEEVEELHVPPFILQPIIENAIKHGFDADHQRLHIAVAAKKSNDRFILLIRNDGAPLSEKYTMGTGLQNIQDRLASIYGSASQFTIENENTHVVVRIQLTI